MKKYEYLLNVLLAAVVSLIMLVCIACRTFQPAVVLPALNIPNMIIASVIALVLNQYLNGGTVGCWPCTAVLAGITFGLFPFVAGVAEVEEVWKLVLAGGAAFTATERIFTSSMDRMASGPAGRLAPVSMGLVLVFVSQIFAGMIL